MRSLVDVNSVVFEPPSLGCVMCLSGLPGSGPKIFDRSPYGNTATIVGAAWVKQPGGIWCLSFDGVDDHIICNDTESLDIQESLTLELWLRFTEDPPVATSWSIMEKGGRGGGTNNFALYTETHSTVLRFGAGFDDVWASFTVTSGPVGLNNWHHIAVTYDGSYIRSYIDGIQDLIQVKDGLLSKNNNNLLVFGTADCAKGYTVLNRIYTRALPSLEIAGHFEKEKNLFGAWKR